MLGMTQGQISGLVCLVIVISDRSLYVLLEQYYSHSHMEKQKQQHLAWLVAIYYGKFGGYNNQ